MKHNLKFLLISIVLMLLLIHPVMAVIPTSDKTIINPAEKYTVYYVNETDPTNITAYYLLVTTSKSNESENITLAQVLDGNYSAIISTTYEKTATQGNTKVGVDWRDTITNTISVNSTETVDVSVYHRFGLVGVVITDIASIFSNPIVKLVIAVLILTIIFALGGFVVGFLEKIGKEFEGMK